MWCCGSERVERGTFWEPHSENHHAKFFPWPNRFLLILWLFPLSPNKTNPPSLHLFVYTRVRAHTHTYNLIGLHPKYDFLSLNTGRRGGIGEKPLTERTMMVTYGGQCLFTQVQIALAIFIISLCFLKIMCHTQWQLLSQKGILKFCLKKHESVLARMNKWEKSSLLLI